MKSQKLAGLQPENVFAYFEKLCSIPHGSRNTGMIADYLVEFAKENHIAYRRDEADNVCMFAPGTCGMEEHPSVILQGHTDMVCVKDADCNVNFLTDGLDLTHDDACVYAKGTTLGGDDGIAVALCLALLADPTIPHPPLEVMLTSDEEIGMLGAAALDTGDFKGRTLINMDSEEEGIFTVSCAGGARSTITLPVTRRAVYGPCVRLRVDGLQGGHSGMEIDKNRANANKVMGTFLQRVQQLMPVCLTKLRGGEKENAIPSFCEATFVAMGIGLERINDVAVQLQKEIREQYDEPNAAVEAFDVDALGGNGVTTEDSAKIISLLCAAPNGVQSYSQHIEGLVQTSLNMGVVRLEDDFTMTFAVRSSLGTEKEELLEQLRKLADFSGAVYSQMGEYPAWEYRENSPLRDVVTATYERMFGKKPQILAIHAGLECGLLSEKLPGLDCVSFGPNMHDVHTSRERLEIESVSRTWDFLLAVLKQL